ncbi:MAG TPA: RNA polymerase subunit sigma-70 [Actinophytocola sp.]|uniref:RNA polymerase subunit sigma-70 n=1 Tax=Actinophytocola sp. TaxID=1872138 RepID=UPI002DDC971B|nr:RNA polymerase subunit sigma-70 [Actinophytocola sp.]HEV2779666.1 RNA polymerase subunit sigma-70 [Actinophytocola sp.]
MSESLLVAARSGDGAAFRELVEPHRAALHLHCYRMLGSYHDAEEAMQEVLLRAWRHLDGYRGQAPLLHWLYRIATTSSLKIIEARARRPGTIAEIDYLEPYPDRLLDALPADSDPAAAVERRESVSLAFIAALQLLPATQRAVVILRDVLAWRAEEVAVLLESTVPAVNSALQRARSTLRDALPGGRRRPLDAEDRRVLARFVDAWHRRDISGLAALLREDVELRMPPEEGLEFRGRAAVLEFFATVPADGALDRIPLVPTRANGQPAVAAYMADDTGELAYYGVMVFAVEGGRIATITGFPAQWSPRLEAALGVRPDPQATARHHGSGAGTSSTSRS